MWLLYSWINCFAASLNWLAFRIINFFQEAAWVFLEFFHVTECLPIASGWITGWLFLSSAFVTSECCRHCSNAFCHWSWKPTDFLFFSLLFSFSFPSFPFSLSFSFSFSLSFSFPSLLFSFFFLFCNFDLAIWMLKHFFF